MNERRRFSEKVGKKIPLGNGSPSEVRLAEIMTDPGVSE
jgi:hypothetical protein